MSLSKKEKLIADKMTKQISSLIVEIQKSDISRELKQNISLTLSQSSEIISKQSEAQSLLIDSINKEIKEKESALETIKFLSKKNLKLKNEYLMEILKEAVFHFSKLYYSKIKHEDKTKLNEFIKEVREIDSLYKEIDLFEQEEKIVA